MIGRSDGLTEEVFISSARSKGSPIIFADKEYKVERVEQEGIETLTVRVRKNGELIFERLVSGLAGIYQAENISSSLAALDILRDSFDLSDKSILEGFRNVVTNSGIEGRWQTVRKEPLVICDTAHNLDGISVVLQQIAEFKGGNIRFVIGFVNDKEIGAIVDLFPQSAEYYLTKSSVLRSMPVNDLAERFSAAGLKYRKFEDVMAAYKSALKESEPSDLIYIGGSTFIVADFLESL